MDPDKTWHGGRPRPKPNCVGCGPSFPSPKRAHLQFSAHAPCGKTAGWIKMPLGREVGLGPGHIVLDGDPPAPPPKRHSPPNIQPMSIVAKRSLMSGTAEHLLPFILLFYYMHARTHAHTHTHTHTTVYSPFSVTTHMSR